ncbi:MAG: hypothetical protein AMXMBFR56_72490 [Polyangiaceae bacterium]
MATKKQIGDTCIDAIKTECAGDRMKLLQWYAEVSNRLARRAQKVQELISADRETFVAASATEFAAHQAAQDALRAAEGIGEE